MKPKILLLALTLLLWANSALATELNMSRLDYQIGQCRYSTEIETEPEAEKPGFWANRDPWTKKDTYWQTAFIVITTIDIYNTAKCMETGDYYEANPIVQKFIGKNPTPEEVYIFGAEWMIFHSAVSRMLPKKYRRVWQSFVIVYTAHDITAGAFILF